MDILSKHVTIRNFKNEPISEEILEQILNCGVRASTTGNMQWYSIVVTSDSTLKNKLASCHFNQNVAKTAPLLLTFCADINRFNAWCLLNNATPGYNNFLSFFNAAIDALLVAQNVCIAAENIGLGICYLGTTTYNAPEIIELLQLPRFVVPITTVAVGWPAESPNLTDRLSLEAVVHKEIYKNYTDEKIRKFYSAKERLDSSKKFVSENNLENLAQVFTNVRYKKSDNEYFSDKFLNVLRNQGFLE
jgi:nitroreductase